MSQNPRPSTAVTRVPADELDPQKVGEILLNAGHATSLAGHASIAGTMRDYVHPTCPEMEFVQDMFTRPADEVIERWYGGEFEAAVRVSQIIDTLFPRTRG